ncbi:cyclase/dehydrase [Polynucleobacter sp. AP-Elch-400A-B2]|uniref:SRPBCC family protein n=1 Tax=Polynucleobacter sp. AP-Elch-400A-B2 TaxID=2576930 RepID=UPI001BFD38F6|nr:SRPBCC family protein [Polynucleobacter sp. AP-Elch-400A-B2]QWE25539.1 cyclase/dehydrase [Polynucleobacter sp. AP-Elch-400A-B2]
MLVNFKSPSLYFNILIWLAYFVCSTVTAQPAFDIKVSIERSGANFQVHASYVVPVGECYAYAFLTDYEAAKNIPGISESKVIHRNANKVKVERVAEERVLFIPIYLRSLLEFSEISDKRLEFIQLEGDAKSYKGSWVIEPDKNGTRFIHHASFELETSIPLFIIQYFLENSARKRFEVMAERVTQQQITSNANCKKYPSL